MVYTLSVGKTIIVFGKMLFAGEISMRDSVQLLLYEKAKREQNNGRY